MTTNPRVRPVFRLSALLLCAVLAGCEGPALSSGAKTNITALGNLKSGISTDADVHTALGTPRGYGMARYAKDQPLRNVWYYELAQAKGDQVGLQIVLVFFKEGTYDGYMWFSSNELLAGPLVPGGRQR